MKIIVCYICVTHGPVTEDFAARFVTTYHEYPPGIEHDTLIIANGGPLPTHLTVLFSGMNAISFPRKNDGGWDISAYIEASKGPCCGYDMMLCCGESIYFHRTGWLKRLSSAWMQNGPGMYGSLSSNLVRSHLNTTGFCCHPSFLSGYPMLVHDKSSRYAFEHGEQSFWRRLYRKGIPVRLVTWDGEYSPQSWRSPPNILWRGNQTNCLMWCQHTDRYRDSDDKTKIRWSRGADRPFK